MVRELETDTEFRQSVAQNPGWVVVDYYAQWCGPCKRFSPTYERLSKEWSLVSFYKVDVDIPELSDTVSLQQIECMPTFVLGLYQAPNQEQRSHWISCKIILNKIV
jgi:thioredoxin 1